MKITKILRHVENELIKKFNVNNKINLKDIFEELEKVSNGFFKDSKNRKYLNLDEKFLKIYLYGEGNPIRSFDTILIDRKNRLCCIEFKNISLEKLENIKQELKEKIGDSLLLFYALNLNSLDEDIFYKPYIIIIYNEYKSKEISENIRKVKIIKYSLNKYKPFCSGIEIISNKELSRLKHISEIVNWI